jgi:glyceraldehyde-3-phosphate dehydrogenase/erythrose-4-phosphate dehydrogenase
MMRVGINGLGRIGRNFLRALQHAARPVGIVHATAKQAA